LNFLDIRKSILILSFLGGKDYDQNVHFPLLMQGVEYGNQLKSFGNLPALLKGLSHKMDNFSTFCKWAGCFDYFNLPSIVETFYTILSSISG
jgi:hypothetical protein